MQIDRSNPPKTDGVIEFHLPKFDKFVLNNGLEVVFVKKTNLPIIKMEMIVNAGSRLDLPNKSGLAYLTSLLIDEGAGKYNSLELDDEIESLGSIFSVSTDNDNIRLSMLSLMENVERSMELLSLVYQSPNFTEDDFKREQKKLLSKIIQHQDEPSYVASSIFDKIIFENTHYQNSVIGNANDVNSINNSDVINFHIKYFIPSNSKLVVVGNIEVDELKNLLNNFFLNLSDISLDVSDTQNPKLQKSIFYFIHKDGAAQSEIRIGHISDTRSETDYFAKVIANSILGGQFSSRLNLNLREDKGFTYGIHSTFAYYENMGYFEISTSVNGKDTGAAIKEIKKEVAGLKTNIADHEIEFTKSYLIKRFPAMFETYSQIANHLSTLLKYTLQDNYFDSYIERITNCKRDEIEAIAKDKIKTDELVYLIVGDKDVVLPQLNEISDSEIIELDVEGNRI